ncbi:MAG TPA: DUF899 family protein [Hyphomonadaceae bacterium]|nr:DUF899 family protein [Hyphomonadaceae bacterium]
MKETARIISLKTRLAQTQTELQEAYAEAARSEVSDYTFANTQGPVKLSELFGDRRDLIIMHAMGLSCANCTMVCDGFNGIYPHVRERASFAVSGPDAPVAQAAFARERGWRFPMISHAGTTFARDMGFTDERGRMLPGVSAFRRDGAKIMRVSASNFHAETEFCAIWRLLDLLPEGANGWRPKFDYG